MSGRLIKQSLVSAALITIGANVVGRFLGFAREAVIADHFGTSAVFDVFLLAFTVPELLTFIIFAALPTAIIPSQDDASRVDNSGRQVMPLFWSGLVAFGAIFLTVSGLIFLLRFEILAFLAPNLSAEHLHTGQRLLAISAPFVFFRGIEAYFRGWLFKNKHFIGPVLSPLLLNISVLASILLLHDRFGIEALALGWVAGAAILALNNGSVAFYVIKPSLKALWGSKALPSLMKFVLAVAVVELISFLYPTIDRYIAARLLSDGQIAALRYASFLSQVAPGILVVTFSAASFPWIADLSKPEALEGLRSLYRESVQMIVFVMAIVVLGMLFFSQELIRLAFQRGAFDAVSAQLTWGPFVAYAVGLVAYSIYIFQMRFYYARKAMLRLGTILGIMLAVKVVASLLLVGPYEHTGLAVATIVTWVVGFLIMTIDLGRTYNLTLASSVTGRLPRLLLALAVAAGFFYAVSFMWPVDSETSLSGLFAYLAAVGSSGAGLYFGAAFLLRMQEPRALVDRIGSRFKKKGQAS